MEYFDTYSIKMVITLKISKTYQRQYTICFQHFKLPKLQKNKIIPIKQYSFKT